MLFIFPPSLLALLATVTAQPADAPKLEMTALGEEARALAADALTDADEVADLELLDHAAVFTFDAAGERQELRLDLADDGRVVGATTWWVGKANTSGRYDLSLAMPALAESATLDYVTVEDDLVVLTAGDLRVPLGDDKVDDDIIDPDDTEPGC
jgi:hypothetical protein